MTKQTSKTNETICTCDYFAPDLRELRSVAFNADRAGFYVELGLSGEGTIDWVLSQFYEYFTGKVHDLNNEPIDLDRLDKNGDAYLDRVFGKDAGRSINRYRERGRDREMKRFRNRLKLSAVELALMLFYAQQIYEWRCSEAAIAA